MATTFIISKRSPDGTHYRFTISDVGDGSVWVNDAAGRTINGVTVTSWQAFSLSGGSTSSIGVNIWEIGIIEVTYVNSSGQLASKWSTDDGVTWA